MTNQFENRYIIQIGKQFYRISIDLIDDCREQILDILSENRIDKKLIVCIPNYVKSYQSFQSNIRILISLRQIRQKKAINLDILPHRLGYNFVVQLLRLDSEQLQYETIYSRKMIQNDIIDAIVHPNGKQVIIINRQSKIEFYQIVRQLSIFDQITYSLSLTKIQQINGNIGKLNLFNTIFDPSGSYILAMHGFNYGDQIKSTTIGMVKLDFKTLTPIFIPDINRCVDGKYLYDFFLKKEETLCIDKDKLSIAIAVGNKNQICIINLQTMDITYQTPFKDSIQIKVPKAISLQKRSKQITQFQPQSLFITDIEYVSSKYLNIKDGGYFIISNKKQFLTIPTITQESKISYNTILYDQSKSGRKSNQHLIIKIDDIDSFVGIYREDNCFNIYKFVYDRNFTISLAMVSFPYSVKRISAIFYYQQNSEICVIYNYKLFCYKIWIKCTPNSPKTIIKQCYQTCKQLGKVWSPFEMECIDCKECQCNSTVKSYNFYRKKCEIDCSLVKNAAYSSGYAFNTKCVCIPPYIWDEELSLCRINCQLVDNTDLQVDYLSLQIDQCQCKPKYRYLNESLDTKVPGMCALICPNNSKPSFKGKQQFCLCSIDQKWDHNLMSCQKVIKNQILFPIWSIVLISLFILMIIVIFCLFVRMIISIAKKGSDIGLVSTNEEAKKLQDIGQQSSLEVCQICNKKKQNKTEYQGSCGHAFHIDCIKMRLKKGDYSCPSCGKILPIQIQQKII